MDVLITDKTGTLTDGTISFRDCVDPAGQHDEQTLRYGLLATDVEGQIGGNSLDTALWQPSQLAAPSDAYRRMASVPFDHQRRMTSALVSRPDGGPLIVVKGARESVLARCVAVPPVAQSTLDGYFAQGSRVVAVASRPAPAATTVGPADEHDLHLDGFLVFLDPPKADAAGSLRRLADLGITVKIATGDNAVVAAKVCGDLGLASDRTLSGADIDGLDDAQLMAAAAKATIFARVSPNRRHGSSSSCAVRTSSDSSATGSTTRSRSTPPTSGYRSRAAALLLSVPQRSHRTWPEPRAARRRRHVRCPPLPTAPAGRRPAAGRRGRSRCGRRRVDADVGGPGLNNRDDGEPQTDRYLLQFWPAPPERARVLKQTSRQAAKWHAFATSPVG
jgi:haloacid dehalogenase-like hydrolase